MLATGVPERDHFEIISAWPAIDKVSRSRRVQASSLDIPCVLDPPSDARLLDQRFERRLQIAANCSSRAEAVSLHQAAAASIWRSALGLTRTISANSAVLAKPFEQCVARNAFFAVGFFERVLELGLECRWQAYGRVRVLGEHCDDGSFGKRHPLKDDLARDDGSSGDLHGALVLPGSRDAMGGPYGAERCG